jgi:endonuclease/exonuclease/phosphatase family metal-dependent hydrolase
MALLRIATFNVACAYLFGPCAWSERQLMLRRLIETAQPDVLGLQEILPSRLADAANLVAPLTLVPGPSTGPTRWFAGAAGSEGNPGGEHLPIAYRADRFDLHDTGWLWISATPDRPGSMLPLARTPFLVHWARLAARDLSGRLLVMNATFGHTPWHHAPTAQVVNAQLSALEAARFKRAGAQGNAPSVFRVRDFNAMTTSEFEQSPDVLSGAGPMDSAMSAAPAAPFVTYQWGRGATRSGLTLDYVLARKPLHPTGDEGIDARHGGLNPSDHHLLVLESDQDGA